MLIPNYVSRDVSLKKMNSWGVGGNADFYCAPLTIEELKGALKWAINEGLNYQVLGGGTNVLISDKGLRGLTIHLARFSGIEVSKTESEVSFICLAGTSKSDLLKQLLKFKLEAALFLAGIPGSIGGGVAMNAGVGESLEPREFVEIVNWIEVLKTPSLSIKRFESVDLKWDYRHCGGWQDGIITRVGIKLLNDPRSALLERVRLANRTRAIKQPLDLPNCGSVFRNPPDDKAGRLIEATDLKAYSVGGARVSEKHANFIVNSGKATAGDINHLILYIQKEVSKKWSIDLKTEVVRFGEF